MRVAVGRCAIEATDRARPRDLRRVREEAEPGALPSDVHTGVEIVDLRRRGGNEVVAQRCVVELDRDHSAAWVVPRRQILARERQQIVDTRIDIDAGQTLT